MSTVGRALLSSATLSLATARIWSIFRRWVDDLSIALACLCQSSRSPTVTSALSLRCIRCKNNWAKTSALVSKLRLSASTCCSLCCNCCRNPLSSSANCSFWAAISSPMSPSRLLARLPVIACIPASQSVEADSPDPASSGAKKLHRYCYRCRYHLT